MRGQVWGKKKAEEASAAPRPKLQEKDSKYTIHMAGCTYTLRREKKTREVGDRSTGRVVRGRAWGKAAAGRPKLQEMDRTCMIQLAGDTYPLHRGKKTRGMGDKSRV